VQPLHIADMAVYLASDEAAVTTGQIMVIDSGVTIY
jgi:enoyl-[acyl-carrier-protein] reductase (NADH)